MNEGLAAAIDNLYTTFAAVPKPAAVDGCSCCWLPSEAVALLQPVPLRCLPALALEPYAQNVPFTVGSAEDFRHFLPRLLEVSVTCGFAGPDAGYMGFPDLESFFGRLRHTEWTTWDPAEQTAVRDFLAALWLDTLTTDPAASKFTAGEVLCALGNAEDDLTPYLRTWTALLPNPHLAVLRAETYVNAFWNGREAQLAQVDAWLRASLLEGFLAEGTASD